MTDFQDRSITPGDTIAYAVRRRSRMWLTRADVIEVHDDYIVADRGDRHVKLRSSGTIVVVVEGR